MERVADYVIRKVNEAGAGHIFMISGRGVLYLTDAVAKNKNILPVSTYHEQGASYAAMAYAAARNTIAACLVSTGCASTNAVTACLCAYQDNLPVIFISGNNILAENTRHTGVPIRTYGQQEADIIDIVKSCTKYAVMLDNELEVVREVEEAIYIAQNGRKGPVWIDIPLDVQNKRIDDNLTEHFEIKDTNINEEDLVRFTQAVAEKINQAKRPILLIGGGCKGCRDEIKKIVDHYQIPIVFSPAACDVYGTGNSLSIGAIGSIGGSRAGNFSIQNADFILAVGTKLSSQLTGRKSTFARQAEIIVVDIDPQEHKKDGVDICAVINADAKKFFKFLSRQNILPVDNEWTKKCSYWKEKFSVRNEKFIQELKERNILDIYEVADIISSKLPSEATIITDAGFEELIIPSTIHYAAGHKCLFPANQGAMGYAIPAIIGAYKAGCKNILCLVGDGSIMMNMQELAIIADMHIPVKIFVINNNMYAVIRRRQQDLFRHRTIGNDPSDGLPAPDFSKIASCFGFKYECMVNLFSFEDGIENVLKETSPMLIELICVHEQKYLHESYTINEKRRLVHRPIEDMSPFLDREIIKKEMIVDMLPE